MDIEKLFICFTYHVRHDVHSSRLLNFYNHKSRQIKTVDHVSQETPLRPLIVLYQLMIFQSVGLGPKFLGLLPLNLINSQRIKRIDTKGNHQGGRAEG